MNIFLLFAKIYRMINIGYSELPIMEAEFMIQCTSGMQEEAGAGRCGSEPDHRKRQGTQAPGSPAGQMDGAGSAVRRPH